jgi:GTP cyclohydrolase II
MDLINPIKGPLKAIRDSKVCEARAAMRIIKETQLLPSIVVCDLACGQSYSEENNLTYLESKELIREQSKISKLKPIVSADLPISVAINCKMIIFRSDDGTAEHYVFQVGNPSRDKPLLTRLHSTCFTGDVLGSLKCDCGPQLNGALEQIANYGAGILLYLNQEGRGIGLANKIRAYSLQDQGFDTVEANHRLGFEDDERDYKIGAEILKDLGFSEVRLLTNNPQKVSMLKENGINVITRLPLKMGETDVNRKYLSTKAKKSGHIFD